MGGGGGGGGTTFQAQGSPPGFDYATAAGLNQMAIGADIQSYALTDQDFANRYPALQSAYDQYQASLNQQVAGVAAGAAGQGQIMQGLGGQILGRMGTPTTSDINALRGQAGSAATAVQPIFNLGASQAGLAQPIYGVGQQQLGVGNQIGQTAATLGGIAGTPYNMGQQLLNEPIDPQTQQQMMRAGLTGAAGAFGPASLGQGMAGQAAAARALGLNTLQYGQAMRGEGMGDIGQAASILGSAGQMQGLGGQMLGGGAQTMGLAGGQLGGAGQLYGMGAQTAATTGGMYGTAQNLQENYAMDTAQMANIYGNLQAEQAATLNQGMGLAGQLFPKRPFGLGGTNLAQSELGQAGAYNSFQQANYATMNGIAFNSAQMQAQQQQLQQQQSASMLGAGVSMAGTAVSAASAATMCWVARAIYQDSRWRIFRHWLVNKAPSALRRLYIRHGQRVAQMAQDSLLLRCGLRLLMDRIVRRVAYVGYP